MPPTEIVAERPADESNQIELPTVRPDGKPQRYDRNGVPILKKHELLELIKKQSTKAPVAAKLMAPMSDDDKIIDKIFSVDKIYL